MADLSKQFKKFDEIIVLSKSRTEEVIRSRDAVRDLIRDWMNENDHGPVKFYMQGSVAMHTAINPINSDDEFDIDDGLYLEAFKDSDEDWPGCDTVHKWVKESVESHTTGDVIDKNTCVRVPFKHGYHIDIPIYIIKNDIARLAHKRDDWIVSDAKDFKDWLAAKNEGSSGQLLRIIRYLKRWKDNKDVELKGIELTILTADNYIYAQEADDIALRRIVEEVANSLLLSYRCDEPVSPYKNLFSNHSESKKMKNISAFCALRESLRDAANEDNESRAVGIMKDVFGDDFPGSCGEIKKAVVATATYGILKRDGRSG